MLSIFSCTYWPSVCFLFFLTNVFILIRGSLLYNIVLVLPYINMKPPRVYTCFQSWTPFPLPSPYHPYYELLKGWFCLEWEMQVHQQIEKGRCSRWVGDSYSSPHPHCLGHAAHHLVPWMFRQGQVPLCLRAFGWAHLFLLLDAFPQDTLLTNSHAKFKSSSIRSCPPYSFLPWPTFS